MVQPPTNWFFHTFSGKTLEAFLEGDVALQKKLNRVIHSDNDHSDNDNNHSDNDNNSEGEHDITLKSEAGYDVVLKGNSNKNNKNNKNINNNNNSRTDDDGDYSSGADHDESRVDHSGYDEDNDEEDERNDGVGSDSDDGSYKAS